MTWNKDLPKETNSFADVPQIAQENFKTTEDLFGEEHYTLGEAACGTHIAGCAGFVKSGSTAVIAALTSPGSGALAWDTTVGWWKRYWKSAWAIPGSATKWSRIRAYSAANQNLTSVDGETQTATVTLGTESYDSLSEFTANTFTPLGAGYYLVVGSVSLSGSASATTSSLITYPQTAVQEKWTASMTSRPTADISTGWTAFPTSADDHYGLIDEVNLGTTDGISAAVDLAGITPPSVTDRFQHTKFAIPAGATVNKVQVIAVSKSDTANQLLGLAGQIRIDSVWFSAAYQVPLSTYNENVFSWAVNPATTATWTVDEINEVGSNCLSGFGVRAGTVGHSHTTENAYLAQSYLKVDYTLANNNYINIDESTVNDNDFLFLAATSSGTASAEVVSALSAVLPTSQVKSMSATVSTRAKCLSSTGAYLGAVLRIAGTDYYSSGGSAQSVSPSTATLTEDFTTYTFCWSANPAGTAWTSGAFDGTSSSAISAYGFYIHSSLSNASTAMVSQCNLTYSWGAPNQTASVLLRKGGTVTSSATKEMHISTTETDEQIHISDMVYLTAGQTIDMQITKTINDDVIMSGSDATYLAIHRLGSQGF